MWECSSIGIELKPGINRPPYRGGPILSYKGQESEMHTLYPACKMVRTNSKEEMSLLHPDGTLRGSCKNRSFNAKYVIFCLSATKEPSATNFQGTSNDQ